MVRQRGSFRERYRDFSGDDSRAIKLSNRRDLHGKSNHGPVFGVIPRDSPGNGKYFRHSALKISHIEVCRVGVRFDIESGERSFYGAVALALCGAFLDSSRE